MLLTFPRVARRQLSVGLIAVTRLLTATIGAASAHADVIVALQYNGPSSSYQGSVEGVAGDSANWQGSVLLAQGPADGSQSVGLFRFDDSNGTGIGTIPDNASITSAILTLTASTVYPSGTLYAAPITSAWTGGGIVASLPSIDTTSPTSAAIPAASGPIDFDITSIVQDWVDGSLTNNGVAVYSTLNRGAKFRTSNAGYNYANAPLLTITYTAVPEPASLGLVAVGATAMLAGRRRRRAS